MKKQLSSAAQSIWNAWENSPVSLDFDQSDRNALAAGLRAAADQLDDPTSAHTLYAFADEFELLGD